ncbi:MAG: FKBP-type peptidyl-prolyl cis-trans isomerase [Bacteroidota bacterium]
MILRLSFLGLALGVLAGCGGGSASGPGGNADLSGLTADDADPFAQLAYDAGYQSGQQMLTQDSTFSFERFREGFAAGIAGDSSEIAYAFGLQAGLGISADTLANIDANVFLTGLRAGIAGDSALVPEDVLNAARMVVEDSLQMRQLRAQAATNPQAAQRLEQIRSNGAEAETFLAEARARDGYQATESGVVFAITEAGDGASPSLSDRVRVLYEGRFANGEVFDASGDEPSELPVGGVVPGFREMILAMAVGESRTFVLPPDVAYGLSGSPGPGGQGGIPPNAALEFDVTLVEIAESAAPQPQFQIPGQ